MVKTRNILSSEYYKNKMELRERKSQLKGLETGELDYESLNKSKQEKSDVLKDPKLKNKFLIPDVADFVNLSKPKRSRNCLIMWLFSTILHSKSYVTQTLEELSVV